MSNFLGISRAKNHQNPLIFESYSKNKNGRFLGHGVDAQSITAMLLCHIRKYIDPCDY